MAGSGKTVERAAADLYGLPPAEFTGARDERAKALRKEGRRHEADAVKALRKPTVAAWALNQLARRRGKEVETLLEAGEELRRAQEELLAGGDRKAFQRAAARERHEAAKLADEAARLVSEAGERAGSALREKIAETLHAAALDEETAEELRAGRLVREREAIGGFAGVVAAGPAPDRGRGAKRAESPPNAGAEGRKPAGGATRGKAGDGGARGKAAGGGAARGRASDGRGSGRTAADAAAREDRKRRADAERRDAAERRQRLAAARTDERHARRELEAAAKAVVHSESRAEAARVHADEANARAKVTADRLKEARREQAAAKKAHARAERSLEAAERSN